MKWLSKLRIGIAIVKIIIENYDEILKEIKDDQVILKQLIAKIKALF
jgi:hypothetical protein